MSSLLQDHVSSGLCGCGRAGTRKLSSCSMEPAIRFHPLSRVLLRLFWSFHQWQRCTDVAQILNTTAFPRRAHPKEETSRGRKVKLLPEGNRSVPKATDVSLEISPGSAGSVLLTPASFKGAERLLKADRDPGSLSGRSCWLRFGSSLAPPAPRCRRLPLPCPLPAPRLASPCADLPPQTEPAGLG